MGQSYSFDEEAAEKYLSAREHEIRQLNEHERLKMLEQCTNVLKDYFQNGMVEVYLVGSIIQPFQFHKNSDIDIVLKGFTGDRFEIWTKLEKALNRSVEIIPFETCHFQEHILKYGLKVI